MADLDVEGQLRRRWPFGWRVYREAQRSNVGFMAGTIAYRAFLSLLPLLVLVFLLVALVGNEALANRVVALAESFLPAQVETQIVDAIEGRLRATGTSVVTVLVLLWGATGLFRGLDTAFSEIYATTELNSFVDQVVDALVTFVVLLVAVVAALAGGTAFALLSDVPLIGLLTQLVLVIGFTLAFLPMYYVFPDTDVTLRTALPGAAVAGVGWAVLHGLFQLYASVAGSADVYGAIGGILVLLTWLNFGGAVILLGGVVNAVLLGRDGDETTGETPAGA